MDVIIKEYPQLFPIFFIVMWCCVSFILSKFGGWHYLAKQYPFTRKFNGKKYYFNAIKMGLVNYRNCITVGVNNTELYLGVMFLFRIGHKPMKIPLAEITGKQIDGIIFDYVILSIKNINIKIPKKLADKIVVASNGAWNYSVS